MALVLYFIICLVLICRALSTFLDSKGQHHDQPRTTPRPNRWHNYKFWLLPVFSSIIYLAILSFFLAKFWEDRNSILTPGLKSEKYFKLFVYLPSTWTILIWVSFVTLFR